VYLFEDLRARRGARFSVVVMSENSVKLSSKRRWVYRLLTVTLVPLLFVTVVECVLRLCGYGWPTTFALQQEFNGQTCYVRNKNFTRRFFQAGITRKPRPFAYPVDKDDDVFRIFVLGSSAAAGDPNAYCGFERILRVMLQAQYPDLKIEIINTAATAINSHAVREIAKECAGHQGDLFIVYLGNNEVVGAFGAGNTSLPLHRSLTLIRTRLWLGRTRLGQFVAGLLPKGATRQQWRGMEMFLERQVRADDPDLQYVYNHFRANLEDSCDLLAASGAPVVLSTVGVNLRDCAPLGSLHRSDLTESECSAWDSLYEKGVGLEADGQLREAIRYYREAAAVDGQYADLHYRLGRCYGQLGEHDRAKAAYVMARDSDTLRFRADTQINRIIREVAASRADRGICLVDAAAVLAGESPHGIPGHELFYEHVHLNFAGNYALARTVLREVEKRLPTRLPNKPSLPSVDECAGRLAFTPFHHVMTLNEVLKRLKKAPFTDQLDNRDQVARLQKQADDLVHRLSGPMIGKYEDICRRAISLDPADPLLRYNFGLYLLLVSRNPQAAIVQLRETLALGIDDDGSWRVSLSAALVSAGRGSEAEKWLREVVALFPDNLRGHCNLAVLLQSQGRIAEAIEHYEAIIAVEPNTDAICDLAWLLATNPDPGIRNGRRALALAGEEACATDYRNPEVLDVLAAAYAEAGQFSRAIETARNAIMLLRPDQTRRKAEIEARLRLYEAGCPIHQAR